MGERAVCLMPGQAGNGVRSRDLRKKEKGCRSSWKDMVSVAVGLLPSKLIEINQRRRCQDRIEDQPWLRTNIFELWRSWRNKAIWVVSMELSGSFWSVPASRKIIGCQGDLLFQPQLHGCSLSLQWNPLWGLLSRELADEATWRLVAGGDSPGRKIFPKHEQVVVWKWTLPGALSWPGHQLGVLFFKFLSDFSSRLWECRVHLKFFLCTPCLGLSHRLMFTVVFPAEFLSIKSY